MKKLISAIFLALCVFLLTACQATITTTVNTTPPITSVTTVNTTTSALTTTETTSTLPSIIHSLSIEYDSLTTEEEV
ncbi:MAG: hypothetical protein Q8M70_02305, partial [bacterium]|nr:hypothetical protein [bacterium]